MGPLGTVKQELLVRYLDAWTPAALHAARAARRLTYLDGYPAGPATTAAVRVFAEFADLLAGHRMTVLLAGEHPALAARLRELAGGVAGLVVREAGGDLLAVLRADQAPAGPVLAYLDPAGQPPPAAELLAALGGGTAAEAMLILAADSGAGAYRAALRAAGFRFAVGVELVAPDEAELLCFATSAVRGLERFKDELWAVDEFAGVRYRDPSWPHHPPLDISLEPHVGPLREALLARLAAGGAQSLAQLREYTLAETMYRPADVVRAVTPLLAAGRLTREPPRGRLTPQTILHPA